MANRSSQKALFLLAAILIVAETALAQIQITSMSGASVATVPTSGLPVLLGGIAGAPCTAGENSVCNNCVTPDQACNTTRVHPNLEFQINFKVTGEIQGEVYLGYSNNGSRQAFSYFERTSGVLSKDSVGFVRGTWGEICSIVLGDQSCDGTDPVNAGNFAPITLYVHVGTGDFADANSVGVTARIINPGGLVDLNNTIYDGDTSGGGIWDFRAHPGDEKAYIKNLSLINCPNLQGTTIKKARVFYSTVGFADASFDATIAGRYRDFTFTANCEPEGDWVVEGLENNVKHFFRAAVLDEANNALFITRFANGVGIDTIPGCNAEDDLGCEMIATPDNVFGLLPEDFNCFIATAAYGSPFAKKVQTFRNFRDQFLKRTTIGRQFINFYYKTSPPIAKYIAENSVLKRAAQIALWPAWVFAELSLAFGFTSVVLTLIGFMISTLWFWRRAKRLTA